MSATVRNYLLLALLAAIWGSAFALIKVAVATIPPFTVAAARIGLAWLILHLVMRRDGLRLPPPQGKAGIRAWRHFVVIGLLGNAIPFTLVAWGELEVSSSLAAILIGAMPMFTVVLAHYSRVERIQGSRSVLGIALGFLGLLVLVGPTVLAELGRAALAQLAVAAAACAYGAAAVYARGVVHEIPVISVATGSLAAAAIVMLPAALILELPWRLVPSAGAVSAVAFLGVAATAWASLIYFRLLHAAGPTFTSLVNYLIPVVGAALGVAWLGETIGIAELLALALILSGIGLVRSRPVDASA